jgi:hypothetical protein
MKITNTESNQYASNPNIVFFNMFINSNVNSSEISKITDSVKTSFNNYVQKLNMWINSEINKNKIKNKQMADVFDAISYFLSNVFYHDLLTNTNHLIFETIKESDDIKKYVKEDKSREIFRYYMFCFISLVYLLLNESNPDTYIIAYHCKSGQDRTGTFFAINQYCNYVFIKNKVNILNDLQPIVSENIKKHNKLYTNNILLDVFSILIKYFKPNPIYTEYYLIQSYLITWYSTGIPGIKWNLGEKKVGFLNIENKFAHLLTQNESNAKLLEGFSQKRGS